jgi:DNA-binding winged helix-turn-helix (wHTH) protein/Tol biopolymer transport system component
MTNKGKDLYEFGPFRLDPTKRVLLRDSQPIPLQLKAFETLLVLVRHSEQVVLKEDLMRAVWPNTFVEEGNLTQNIFMLRKTLGSADGEQRYIDTIPGRGYRFAAKVRLVSGETEVTSQSPLPTEVVGANVRSHLVDEIVRGKSSRTLQRAIGACALVLLLALAVILLRPTIPPPRVTRIRQITHLGTLLHNTRLITDGPRIYFRAWEGKERVLRAVSTEGGQVYSVENPISHFDIYDISSNGSEFLETNEDDLHRLPDSQGFYASLWRVPVPSGSPRPVGKLQAADTVWAPDGRTVAYSFSSSLYRASADGTEAHLISKLPGDPIYFAWSPDGNRLRFTVADPSHAGDPIWQADFSTNAVRPLIPDSPNAALPWAGGWTADERYFLFSAITDGTRNIWAIREKKDLLHRVNPQAVQLTNGPINYYLPLPSKDGKRVFAVGEQLRGQLVRYDAASQKISEYSGAGSADFVSYSHDGKWIAYVEFPEGNLVRSRVDGTDRRQLTFPPMRAFTPRWSPDDTRILFQASAHLGAANKIYLIPRDGGTPSFATPASQDRQTYPSWTADGNSVLFSSSDDSDSNSELHVLNLKTEAVSVLPSTAGLEWAQISPDGRGAAAVRKSSGDLVLYDFDSHATQVIAKMGLYPRWSDDGKWLYFNSPYFDPGRSNGGVYRWDRATQSTHMVAKYPEFLLTGAYSVSYGVTPDGAILFLRDTTIRDLYALDLELP